MGEGRRTPALRPLSCRGSHRCVPRDAGPDTAKVMYLPRPPALVASGTVTVLLAVVRNNNVLLCADRAAALVQQRTSTGHLLPAHDQQKLHVGPGIAVAFAGLVGITSEGADMVAAAADILARASTQAQANQALSELFDDVRFGGSSATTGAIVPGFQAPVCAVAVVVRSTGRDVSVVGHGLSTAASPVPYGLHAPGTAYAPLELLADAHLAVADAAAAPDEPAALARIDSLLAAASSRHLDAVTRSWDHVSIDPQGVGPLGQYGAPTQTLPRGI